MTRPDPAEALLPAEWFQQQWNGVAECVFCGGRDPSADPTDPRAGHRETCRRAALLDDARLGRAVRELTTHAGPYEWEVTRHPTSGPHLYTVRVWDESGHPARIGDNDLLTALRRALGESS